MFSLWREIGNFEKRVPFFTKSKATIFFAFENDALKGSFYGVYLNDDLVKTGIIDLKEVKIGKGVFLGDFPVRSGKNIIGVRVNRDKEEIYKKFEIELPEFRRVAVEILFSGVPPKIKVVPRAWLVE